jgi:hypothetical protein
MPQTKTCPKCGGVMKLKDEIEEDDAVLIHVIAGTWK